MAWPLWISFFCVLVFYLNPTLIPHIALFEDKDLDLVYGGDWAVVCGASRGVGVEWVFALAERGYNVILVDHDPNHVEQVRDEIQHVSPFLKFRAVHCDLSDVSRWKQIAQELAQQYSIGFVVYNAAVSSVVKPHASTGLSHHERIINLNVHSALIAVDAFVPAMRSRHKGALVLMSSADGENCTPKLANHAGTMAWTTRFAESLWWELKPYGVRVLSVIAGLTTVPSTEQIALLQNNPRDVVIESLRALFWGTSPTVVTGHFTKLLAWAGWFLPRSVQCSVKSDLSDYLSKLEKQTKSS